VSATRPGPAPLTAAAVAAVLVAAFALLTPGQRAATLGLTRHGQTLTAQDAGAADAVAVVTINAGTPGQVYTISDAGLPHWAAAPSGGGGGGATVTTLYAANGTPIAGGGAASVSGTGSTSTFTLTGAGSADYGSAGVTAPSLSFSIPAGAREIEAELQTTALNNVATGGFRFVSFVLRNSGTSIPAAAWGVSFADNGNFYAGAMLSGANQGGGSATGAVFWPYNNLDRWVRVTLLPRVAFLAAQVAQGAGSGLRPTSWLSPGTAIPLPTQTTGVPPDTGAATAFVVVLQSYSAGASTVTGRVTVRVTQ
jgi:hypothetical protein